MQELEQTHYSLILFNLTHTSLYGKKNYTYKKYSKYSKQGGYYESSPKREQVLFKDGFKDVWWQLENNKIVLN